MVFGVVVVLGVGSSVAQTDPVESLIRELERVPASEQVTRVRARIAQWRAQVSGVELAARVARAADHVYEAGSPQGCATILQDVPDLSSTPPTRPLLDTAVYLAQLDYAVGDLRRARRHQELAVATGRSLAVDRSELIGLVQTLGYIVYALEDNVSAAAAWSEALAWLEEDPEADVSTMVWLQSDLAEAHRLLGDYAAAEVLQRRAVERARAELPRDRNLAILLNNLGVLLWDQSRLGEGEGVLREALEISRQDEDPTRVALAHMNLGLVLREQGKLVAAEELLEHALELARADVPRDDPRYAYFLVDLARVYFLTDRWDLALPLLGEAKQNLESSDPVREIYLARVMYLIGEGSLRWSDASVAQAAFVRSMDLRVSALGPDHPLVGESMVGVARCAMRREGHDSDEARRLLQRAVGILGGGQSREPEAEAHALLARAYWARRQLEDAKTSMRRSLDLVETLRTERGAADLSRARFLARFAGYGQDMVEWLVETGEVEAALQLTERFRARVLREQLAAARVDLRAGIAPGLLEPLEAEEAAARVQITGRQRELSERRSASAGDDTHELLALEGELDAAVRRLRDARDRIRALSPAWATLARTTREVSLDEVRAVLGPSRPLLLYSVGSAASFGFLITGDDLIAFAVVDGAGAALGDQELAALAQGLQEPPALTLAEQTRGVGGVAEREQGFGAQRSDRLAQLFSSLVPTRVWEQVRGAAEVIVVPDGSLHAFPLEALITDPERYWLDDGPPLRYAHSLATLVELGTQREVETHGVLSLSDPAFGDEAGTFLPRLPGTALETNAIVEAFGAEQTQVLQGDLATEARLRARLRGARYIHLATHGMVEESGHGLRASLALSPPAAGEDGDGMLHLFEIYELELDCQLAVLSACETKRGLQVAGEGVFALSRGFLAAGARQTVGSLWSVSDASTASLMGQLFQGIAQDSRASVSTLLRDAKRRLRADPRWADPFYWAPFVLTGLQ